MLMASQMLLSVSFPRHISGNILSVLLFIVLFPFFLRYVHDWSLAD